MPEFRVEYENNTGPNDDCFWEWWSVTDGHKSFRCVTEEDAEQVTQVMNKELRHAELYRFLRWEALDGPNAGEMVRVHFEDFDAENVRRMEEARKEHGGAWND